MRAGVRGRVSASVCVVGCVRVGVRVLEGRDAKAIVNGSQTQ